MSHEGKMRRGALSTDDTNPDRIYFLENTKPKVEKTVEKPVKKVVKKEKKEE